MQILKFGGSSQANAECIFKVSKIIRNRIKTAQLGIVLSAVGGITNLLVAAIENATHSLSFDEPIKKFNERHLAILKDLSKKVPSLDSKALTLFLTEIGQKLEKSLTGISLIQTCPEKIYCEILSLGERISAKIMYEVLHSQGIPVSLLDPTEYIITTGPLLEGNPKIAETQKKFSAIKALPCILMSGFIAGHESGVLGLLGRNGSDYSASIMAACIGAESCEIWTDVDGILTADPSQVAEPKLIKEMSYGEAMELAFYGAKVLHPKTTAILVGPKIPLYIKNTFNPDSEGTKICAHPIRETDYLICGLSAIKDMALINISGGGMQGIPGMAARVFELVAQCGVSISLITQASSEHSICFGIREKEVEKVSHVLHQSLFLELQARIIENIEIIQNQAIICIVGDEMKMRPGIAGKFFSSLSQASINISAIAQGSSERCISAVIDNKNAEKAIKAVHTAFFYTLQSIELYIFGIGTIGQELITQIQKQQKKLYENNIELKICALANSQKMLYQKEGIRLENWEPSFSEAKQKSDVQRLSELVSQDKPINGIFIDCTSSEQIALCYPQIFQAGLHIVTANKKANSQNFSYYQSLRKSANRANRLFLYETNVGAGLPIIDTLKGLIKSGDQLIRFSGILSGSLSFIFGCLEESIKFSTAVKMACDQKLTEPDPREDLSGLDVARKLLILARESGFSYELSDIQMTPIFPENFPLSGSTLDFLNRLEEIDNYFSKWIQKLKKEGKVLRFIAEINEGRCHIGIQEVSSDSPLYNIKKGENAFAFLTTRYHPIPLVVRGYGAGVSVTASGLFADILKTIPVN